MQRYLRMVLAVLFACGTLLGARPAAAEEIPLPDPLIQAEALLAEGQTAQAETVLKNLVSAVPPRWRSIEETPEQITGHFWDADEFTSYVEYFSSKLKKGVVWKGPSYSKAYFRLAYLASDREDYAGALRYLDQAIALEPDSPGILCETGFVLGKLGRYEEAYANYQRALTVRPWASALTMAQVYRGNGITLIDLNRLDEAEVMLKKSLEFEPGNKVALGELGYIDDLRKKGQK